MVAEARSERVAPWSAQWEVLYDEIIISTALRYGWEEVNDAQISARQRDARLLQLKSVARQVVYDHPVSFLTAHIRAWLWSFVPQDHKFWYTQITGELWASLPVEGDALGRALRAIGRDPWVLACVLCMRSGSRGFRHWHCCCGWAGALATQPLPSLQYWARYDCVRGSLLSLSLRRLST